MKDIHPVYLMQPFMPQELEITSRELQEWNGKGRERQGYPVFEVV